MKFTSPSHKDAESALVEMAARKRRPISHFLLSTNGLGQAAACRYGPLPEHAQSLGKRRRTDMYARRRAVVARDLIKLAYKNGEEFTAGYVYAITNPAWPNKVKFGKAIDVYDRLGNYQTYSPNRDYKLLTYAFVFDRHRAEMDVLSRFQSREGEWVEIDHKTAKDVIRSVDDIGIF